MKKNTFLLLLICLIFIPLGIKAQEAYAVFKDETLTFYYDNSKDSRDGTVYRLNTGDNEPDWLEKKYDIFYVVFNNSFSKARPTTAYRWFDEALVCEIEGIQNLITSSVTNMEGMFRWCINLKNIDLSHFDTSKVTNMKGMF